MAQQPPFPQNQVQNQMQYPSPSQSPKQRRGPVVLVVVLVLVLVAVVVTGAVVLLKADDKPKTDSTKPSTPQVLEFRRVLKAAEGTCASPSPTGVFCDAKGMRYTLGKVELNGSHVSEVKTAQQEDGGGGWYVRLTLDDEGKRVFTALTTDLAGKQPPVNEMAIVVNNEVVTTPSVNAPITASQIQISGNYTKQEADDLAKKITG